MTVDLATRAAAKLLLRRKYGRQPGHGRRDPKERALYAGRPADYFRDILGMVDLLALTRQQEDALELIESSDRVLIPSGNNLGKSFLLGAYGVYVLDALAAVPDPGEGLAEQGARVLLIGPDHPTVYGSIYTEMLSHAARAERLGHPMPGRRSGNSVLWRVRERWEVEAICPPREIGQSVAPGASGRHAKIQVAILEEAAGIREPLWKSVDGMCSSEGNKQLCIFNPTKETVSLSQRMKSPDWKSIRLDAFEHPNIIQQRNVVAAAKDFRVVHEAVRTCRDRGHHPGTPIELEFGDFIYALPASSLVEPAPREDGIPGDASGSPRVYRPVGMFEPQIRGLFPRVSSFGLVDPGAWDAAVKRWKESPDPRVAPTAVGIDCARTGDDDSIGCPRWGEDAETILRAWGMAQVDCDEKLEEELLTTRRVRTGPLVLAPKGDGPEVAEFFAGSRLGWQRSLWLVDVGGVGSSVFDHAKKVLGMQASDVSFGSTAPPPVHEQPWCEDVRAALYILSSMMVNRGLVDVPPDPALREEMFAHEVKHGNRTVKIDGKSMVVPSVRIHSKDEVKKVIGRSPDSADAWVLSLWKPKVVARGALISH